MSAPKTDFVGNAREAWGGDPPDWIVVLAAECARADATSVARRLGYTVAVVSAVVRNKYPGAMAKVEGRIRGAYMGALVDCPVLGEIERDRCLDEQRLKHFGTSAMRTRIYRACRGGCPHSHLKDGGGNE